MSDFYKGLDVAVTGGGGFVGSHLVERLISEGARVRVVGKSGELRNLSGVKSKLTYVRADLQDPERSREALQGVSAVFHLAARVGGIQYNMVHPAGMFAPNTSMTVNVLEGCTKSRTVERVLVVSSTCVYSPDCAVPSREEDGFTKEPDPSNIGYGWAKRFSEKAAMFYASEFGLKVGIVRPENIYGPRDNFSVESSHVIPALIRKGMEATGEFVVWGSGKQTRSFTFVADAAEAMTIALERHPLPDPINIGSGQEITIGELSGLLLGLLGKREARIVYDTSKPEGQQRKAASTDKMKSILGYRHANSLEEGLKRTIEWVRSNLDCLR